MNIQFTSEAWNDYQYWLQNDKKKLRKSNGLIKSASRTPSEGVGKPEPLVGNLSGWWSRRIDNEHRMVYRATGKGPQQTLEIRKLRQHY